MLNTTPYVIYHMPMDDVTGMWKTKQGKYDEITYEYEINNLDKFKEKFNGE